MRWMCGSIKGTPSLHDIHTLALAHTPWQRYTQHCMTQWLKGWLWISIWARFYQAWHFNSSLLSNLVSITQVLSGYWKKSLCFFFLLFPSWNTFFFFCQLQFLSSFFFFFPFIYLSFNNFTVPWVPLTSSHLLFFHFPLCSCLAASAYQCCSHPNLHISGHLNIWYPP